MHELDPHSIEAAAQRVAAAAPAPGAALVDAWRQLHYAAQAASEVGKGWAAPLADDSHSSFGWDGGALAGARVEAPQPFRAQLRARDLELRLVADDGASLAAIPLAGRTLAEALASVRAHAERLAGPARQRAAPAPDLPKHPIGDGAAFSPRDVASFAALDALLDGAASLLDAIAPSLPEASPVRVWPHHFDMAVLAWPARDRTIGVGLAAPDGQHASGYWYVSPWAATPPRDGLRLAALALDGWSAQPPGERAAALARFLRDAIDDAARRLGV
jgi:hypothetical protein